VYVDDNILIASEDEGYKNENCAEYDMTVMGKLDNFLNAKITRACEKISITPMHCCLEVLKTFTF
jgi:hypothetical protein